MKTLNSKFFNDTDTPDDLSMSIWEDFHDTQLVTIEWVGPYTFIYENIPKWPRAWGPPPGSGEESDGCLGHLRTSPWGSFNKMHAAQ